MTNLPGSKARQLPVSGSTSLGSPLATTAPRTLKKDGTLVVRSGVAAPKPKPAPKASPVKQKKTATPVVRKSTMKAVPKKSAAQPVTKAAAKPVAKKAT